MLVVAVFMRVAGSEEAAGYSGQHTFDFDIAGIAGRLHWRHEQLVFIFL